MKTWTKEQLQTHLQVNSKNTYSMAIPLAALYYKLYGTLPDMGLSGFQAENAENLSKLFP